MKFSHNVFDHDTQTMFGFCTYSLYGFRVMLLNYLINEKFVVFMLGLPMAKCFDIFKQRLTTIHRSSCIFAFMPFIFLSYTPVYLSWKHGDLCAVHIYTCKTISLPVTWNTSTIWKGLSHFSFKAETWTRVLQVIAPLA